MAYGGEEHNDYDDNLNWDSVGSPIPLGKYNFELVKAEYKPTKAGKHQIAVQFKVLSAEDPANAEKSKDRYTFDNFGFTQESAFRIKGFATATGCALPAMVNRPILEQLAESIVGLQVGGEIAHRDWNGSIMANIKKFFPFTEGEETVADEVQVESDDGQEEPEAPPGQQTLRQAVSTNGHTNGTNGTAKAAPAKPAAPKPAAPKAAPAKTATK